MNNPVAVRRARTFLFGTTSWTGVAAACAVILCAVASDAHAQQFTPLGRSGPERGYTEDLSSFLPPATGTQRYGTNAGHIVNVVFDPSNPNRIFAGAVNGGVWSSLDGGINWTPLTDKLSSLAISSLSLDLTNPNTIIAGTGLAGTGAFTPGFNFGTDRSPAARNGVIQLSLNGGTTWSEITVPGLVGQTVSGVAVRGSVIMASGYDLNFPTQAGGLFRSTDGGATFSTITLPGRPANGQVSSLIADPANPTTFYAASVIAGGTSEVFKSVDNGATWTSVMTVGTANTALKVATGPGGAVAIYGINLGTGRPNFLALSKDAGATFSNLNAQLATIANTLNGGNQGAFHAGIAINPNNTDEVYLAGDSIQNYSLVNGFYSPVFKVTLNPLNVPASTVTNMTALGLTSRSFVHADIHNLIFDPLGRLVSAGDGGVFRLSTTNPATASWSGLNGTLGTKEQYAIAYDARNKLVATASQDNGSAIQTSRDAGSTFTLIGGDGINVRINDTFLGGSYVYSSAQGLGGINRSLIVPGSQDMVGSFRVYLFFTPTAGSEPVIYGESDEFAINAGVEEMLEDRGQVLPVELGEGDEVLDASPITLRFTSPFILNRVDQTKFAFGGSNVWVGQDTPGNFTGCFSPTPNYSVTECYDTSLAVTSIAKQSGLSLTDSFTTVTTLAYGVTDAPDAVLVGGRRFVGNSRLGLSTTGTLTSLLNFNNYGQGVGAAATAGQPTSVAFDARTVNRIFAADSVNLFGSTNATLAGAPNPNATFTDFTSSLPANFVRPTSLEFISKFGVNALLVGGINSAANAGNPLVTADSDIAGNLSGWRRLGTGLPNTGINTMAYNPLVDVLAVSSYGRGSWLLYDVTTNYASATQLVFGLADNNSNPDISLLSGNRPLIKEGTGTLTITGNANYTGPTTINGGTMVLNGSVLGNLFINPGTVFAGNATVNGNVTNLGLISPGNSPGSVTVVGNYVGGGALLSEVQFNNAGAPVNGTTHDYLNITGNVTGPATLITVLPFAPSAAPTATTGDGVQLVRAGGTMASNAFALSGPVIQGGFEYSLKYLPTFSGGTGSGFFLQSGAREELLLNATLLSASHASYFNCARQINGSPDLSGGNGRAWAGGQGGTFNADGSTGIDFEATHDCYGGGFSAATTPTTQMGMSGAMGNIDVDAALPQGAAKLKADTGLVQAHISYVNGGMFSTLALGYQSVNWTIDGARGSKFDATVEGLVGSLTVGHEMPVGTATTLTLTAALDYNGVECGSGCLLPGMSEDPSQWVGAINARVDTGIWSIRPFAAAGLSTDFGDGSKAKLGNALAISDTQSVVLNVEAGFDAPIDSAISLFAKGGWTEGFDSDVTGARGSAGIVARW